MNILIIRLFWTMATLFNLFLCAVAAIVPLMPASPFVILSLLCIKKASPTVHDRMMRTHLAVWFQRRFPKLGRFI